MSDSSHDRPHRQRTDSSKPAKPYLDFPLFPHASGQWARKINGKMHYFGSWREDPQGTAALAEHNRQYPYLKEGRTPPAVDVSNGCTMRKLANDFLHSKEEKVNAKELTPRSFLDYHRTCEILLDHFAKDRLVSDLRPEDFRDFRAKLAKRFGVVTLKNEVNRIRSIFNYAYVNQLIEKPVLYGKNFDRPTMKSIRTDRNVAGEKLFERGEVLRIIDAADVHIKAMCLLGLNAGFGNTDISTLPLSAVNLETGWLDYPRPKTAIKRRVPLWAETVEALKASIAKRPTAKDPSAEGLVFVTRCGMPWVRCKIKDDATSAGPEAFVSLDALTQAFGKILRKLGINGRRRIGFYTLRHCFETYAGESKDQVAVDAIMGHVDSSMSANYRHRISDERLRDVVNVVRTWLYGTQEGAQS